MVTSLLKFYKLFARKREYLVNFSILTIIFPCVGNSFPFKLNVLIKNGKLIQQIGKQRGKYYPKPMLAYRHDHHHHLFVFMSITRFKNTAGCQARRPQETTRLTLYRRDHLNITILNRIKAKSKIQISFGRLISFQILMSF